MPSDDMTIGEARVWLRGRVDDGENCPVCTQRAQVYRRKIHATMARDLIILYRQRGQEWAHVADVIAREGRTFGGDFGKLAYWELIEELQERREDGGRAGWWRVTELGGEFVRKEIKMPSHARVYNGRSLGLVGDLVSIEECLGNKFDYSELFPRFPRGI